MTSLPTVRRRSTAVAAVVASVGVVLVVALVAIGATTLADSRAGRDVTASVGEQMTFPTTVTGLIGVVDDDGMLTSVAVVVLRPDGIGGNVVVIPPTADSTFVRSGDVLPLRETLEVEGPDGFLAAAEALTAITFDVAELVDAERLVELFGDIGSVSVSAPSVVPDGVPLEPDASGTLSAQGVATALTAGLRGSDALLDPFRVAVWSAVGTHAGSGTSAADASPEVAVTRVEDVLERLFSGRVGVRTLRAETATDDVNPRAVDAVVLDRAEVLLVFGQLAPARVATPNTSLTFRVVASFSDEQLEPYGVGNADVARDVISVLLFLQANVISVETVPSVAPAGSVAEVTNADLIDDVRDGWPQVFGDIEFEVADPSIARIDATIVLGTSYLELRADQLRRNDR